MLILRSIGLLDIEISRKGIIFTDGRTDGRHDRRTDSIFEVLLFWHKEWIFLLETRCTRGDARSFFCTYKTYLYAQNEISYE